MKNSIYTTAIIVAGGKGTRMNSTKNKQFIKINKKEIIAHTIEVFQNSESINSIILVVEENSMEDFKLLCEKYSWGKISEIVVGGAERQNSVYNGLKKVSKNSEVVVIHDGARPFISQNIIENSINTALEVGGCGVGVPVKDTLKICDENNQILSTPNRNNMWHIQTPQTFQKDLILSAYETAEKNNYFATDDTSLMEYIEKPVKIIMGDYNNIKVTTQEDLLLGEIILNSLQKNTTEVKKIDEVVESNQIKKNVVIYTDGACSGNPGAGGYGVVMMYNGGRRELSDGYELTTNNRMELLAVIKGLQALKKPCVVDLYSDSKYVVDTIEKKWIFNWQKNNWVKSDKKPVLNKDLWIDLLECLKIHKVTFHWVKGHAENVENERCDELAREAILKDMLKIDEKYNKNIQ